MEANNDNIGLSSYYNHPQLNLQTPPAPPPSTVASATIPSATNGVVPNSTTNNSDVYTHTGVPSTVSSPAENMKRKRGRPKKYETPEQAAAARKLYALASSAASKKKRDQGLAALASTPSSNSSKKLQLAACGNMDEGFTLHIITVTAGEDVGQKIMMFMQQSKREICIISASGLVSNASLRQPATSGGSVSYEGRFDILSLSGSYIRAERGGGRTGGLSVCLSSTDGQIIGGGIGGPLTAAGPIQVIVGTFQIDSKKDTSGAGKGDAASNKLSAIGGTSVSDLGIWSPADSTHQTVGGNPFMIQHQGMQLTPSHSMEWRNSTGHGMQQSPENGDY
ncbi:unnamed protein product [Fraxinus pennsylvanica]|uniref:AT-hook motif nuclear-localized protein n=1 Tax=Fraxinus pennsylvanica TaxID=56036 RepID=A0AAD2DUY6_9LAMI|nr:unnamed protein product [Fraxinus pennsylvanica]